MRVRALGNACVVLCPWRGALLTPRLLESPRLRIQAPAVCPDPGHLSSYLRSQTKLMGVPGRSHKHPGAICPTAPDHGSGALDGSGHLPLKPAKLDSTDLHDDTSASSAPTSEACSHAVLACSPGIPEEYYVSEAAEDAPSYRGYRDACTITAFTHQPSGETNKQEVIMEEIWVGLDFSPGTWFFLLRRGSLYGNGDQLLPLKPVPLSGARPEVPHVEKCGKAEKDYNLDSSWYLFGNYSATRCRVSEPWFIQQSVVKSYIACF
ncbi:hypothetical protein ACRRTK_002929 [Alexandromys fortis]